MTDDKQQTIMVIGGAGFIGSHLAKSLIADGKKVVVVDDFSNGTLENLQNIRQQIEIIACDDQGTAMAAAICAKDLVNKGVKLVVGSYTSTCAEAAQKTYFKAGVLQTSDGTADSLTENGYWTFLRNSFPNSAEAEFVAKTFTIT